MLLYYIVTSPMNQTESRQQLTTCLNNQTKTKFLIFIKNKQLSLCCSLSSFYFSKKRGFLLSCLVIRVQRPIVSNKKWWSINWILFRMNSFGAAGYHKLLGINSVINVVFLKKKKTTFFVSRNMKFSGKKHRSSVKNLFFFSSITHFHSSFPLQSSSLVFWNF